MAQVLTNLECGLEILVFSNKRSPFVKSELAVPVATCDVPPDKLRRAFLRRLGISVCKHSAVISPRQVGVTFTSYSSRGTNFLDVDLRSRPSPAHSKFTSFDFTQQIYHYYVHLWYYINSATTYVRSMAKATEKCVYRHYCSLLQCTVSFILSQIQIYIRLFSWVPVNLSNYFPLVWSY